jgi:hypothetical protein
MKTLKNLKTGNVVRVSDTEADLRTRSAKEWAYTPKSEWKRKDEPQEEQAPGEEVAKTSQKKEEKKKKKGA